MTTAAPAEPEVPGPCPAPARVLAGTLAGLKRLGVTGRGVFDEVLRRTLEGDHRYLGVWSVWEPNALDGRDHEHARRPGHDETGRYVPLWTRAAGAITVQPNADYDTGEWYWRPIRERRETVVDPYEYRVAGAPRFITTQVAPILVDERCVGVAGVDFAVGQIPGASAAPGAGNALETLLGRGYVFLEEDGRLAYCSARSRALLERFVGPARGSELPWALRRLDPPRSGVISFRTDSQELVIRPFSHPDAGRGLLLLHGTVTPEQPLSPREREVADWMAEGKTNAEIGTILGISLHTVKRHVERVLQKLGVPNRSAAVALGIGRSTHAGPAHRSLSS